MTGVTAGGRSPREGLDPSRRRTVLRQSFSVGFATGAYGISFGALSVASGLSILQTQALSLLLFTGGSQFAVIGILGAGGSGAAAVATSSLLGIRNGLYGLQVSRMLGVSGLGKAAAAHLTIDESTAVGLAQPEPPAQRVGFWATGLAVFTFWNAATLAGSLVGNALGDPRRWGLDAAAAAAFCALLWPRLRSRDAWTTAALAIFLALVTAPVLPAGLPVIVSVTAALLVGLRAPGRHEPPLSDTADGLPGADPTP